MYKGYADAVNTLQSLSASTCTDSGCKQLITLTACIYTPNTINVSFVVAGASWAWVGYRGSLRALSTAYAFLYAK